MAFDPKRLSAALKSVDIVYSLYPYACTDSSLVFPKGAVLLVVERADDGWCRGYNAGVQGWFPASYVQNVQMDYILKKSFDPNALSSILRSTAWTVYITDDHQIYFVNNSTKETSWTMPALSRPHSTSILRDENIHGNSNGVVNNDVGKRRNTKEKPKRPKLQIVSGLTYCADPSEGPELMNPQAQSYIDYFWSDKGEQTGFDVIREKHLNGKFVIKDMIDFFKERAAIEEQYARNLAKLSKSTLGDQEEGTLQRAWHSLKTELKERSEAHSKFAAKITEELEKQLFEFKESQKKDRKQHEQILEKSRKQVQTLDAAIEKAKLSLAAPKGKALKRQSSIGDFKGDEVMKLEFNYNQAQRLWVDNMVAACRDFERQEEERSDFLKSQLLKYIDLCVNVQEANAKALTYSTNMIDNINKKADKEFFIKRKATGTNRPVDRVIELH